MKQKVRGKQKKIQKKIFDDFLKKGLKIEPNHIHPIDIHRLLSTLSTKTAEK